MQFLGFVHEMTLTVCLAVTPYMLDLYTRKLVNVHQHEKKALKSYFLNKNILENLLVFIVTVSSKQNEKLSVKAEQYHFFECQYYFKYLLSVNQL